MTSAEFNALPVTLKANEAAAALRMGVKELRGMVDRGELPAARLGLRRVIRIEKAAVLRLLSGQPPAPTPISPAPMVESGPCKPARRRWKGRPS